MEQQEKRLVKLNPQIIERFENDEEMLMIKGGGLWSWLLGKLDEINVFQCQCTNNCGSNCPCS
ncbi:MAG: hypothetical protein RBR35_04405 [Salinivirgaceae bacterium]|nr:hypothetical protein [Salinivirgaceae bacterium]MDY0279784.1 hypothetical protein [Salinivirgaceae bacterium]